MIDDDFENVFTGDDVKKITEDYARQLEQQKQELIQIKNENAKLKQENERLNQLLQKKQKALEKGTLDIVKCELTKSQAIEENQLMREYINTQNLINVIDLFSWKQQDEQTQMILSQAKEIELLTQQLQEQKKQLPFQGGIKEYSIFTERNTIEELKNQITQNEMQLKQQREAFSEKNFLYETIINYIDSLEKHNKIEKIEEYIKIGYSIFKQIKDQYKINIQIN